LHISILASKTLCYHFLIRQYLLELYSKVSFNKVKTIINIKLQQVIIDQKMITKCFRGQNRDMQKFLWNLDSFKFEAGFETESINCKLVTLATRL
jgi:hypothetical protein